MVSPAAELLYPMFQDALEMLTLTRTCFLEHDLEVLNIASALGRSVHKRENELTEGLLAGPPEIEPLRFIPSHLERIGDALEGVVRCLRTREDEAAEFTDRGMREVRELFDRAQGLLECARDLTRTGNQVLARHVELEAMRFQDVATRLRLRPRGAPDRGGLPAPGLLGLPGHPRQPARGHPALPADRPPSGGQPGRRLGTAPDPLSPRFHDASGPWGTVRAPPASY